MRWWDLSSWGRENIVNYGHRDGGVFGRGYIKRKVRERALERFRVIIPGGAVEKNTSSIGRERAGGRTKPKDIYWMRAIDVVQPSIHVIHVQVHPVGMEWRGWPGKDTKLPTHVGSTGFDPIGWWRLERLCVREVITKLESRNWSVVVFFFIKGPEPSGVPRLPSHFGPRKVCEGRVPGGL